MAGRRSTHQFGALTVHRALENQFDYVRWSINIQYCDAANEAAVSKAGDGYYCFCATDPSRIESFQHRAAQYYYNSEF